jgi:predicted O-methyltransferase YrrM
MIRRAYVGAAHRAVGVLERTGADDWLARRPNRIVRHVWSLSTIYDVERMARLDLPWWTYPASREVDAFLGSLDGGARVFEFGSGASTVWLARRAGEVHSVEHDEPFVERLRPLLEPFAQVHLYAVPPTDRTPSSTAVSQRSGHEDLDFEAYVSTIDEVGGQFDLIVVDGRARATCLERAVPHLGPGGIVVFDNAGRDRYQAAIQASGLTVDMRRGWAPSLPYREATALLRATPAP